MELEKAGMEKSEKPRQRLSGESISYNILQARHVNHGTGELSQIGEVALLTCGPGQRNPKQSMG